jgi:selenocysteine-specific elongation factor
MESETLRERAPFPLTSRLFRALVDALDAEGVLSRDGSLVRLRTHVVRLGGTDRAIVETIRTLLGASSLAPPELSEIESRLGLDRTKLAEVMRVMERERTVVRVSISLYFLADTLDRVKREVFDRWPQDREITPAAFRDITGTTRKYAIPLLEYFDRAGVTQRVGAARRLRGR